MFSVKTIFIIVKSIELLIFVLYGKRLANAKSDKEFWKRSLIPIFTFGIIEGLRFGRGIDWNVYFYRYTNLANKTTGDYEFLFEHICNIEGALNIPYPIFIMINEFAFIVGIFFIISRFKQYSTYILPFVLSYTLFNENFIRWSMAIVFIFGGVYCLLSNKIIKSYLFVLLGFLTHSGSIIIVPFFVLFKILKDRQLTPIVSTLLLVVTTFVLSLANLGFLIVLSKYMGNSFIGDIQAGGYFDATESLLAGTWGTQGIGDNGVLFKLRFFLGVAPIIYFAPRFIKKGTYENFVYNLFLIGCLISPLFSLIEIFNRFSALLSFFGCIIGGVVYYNILQSKKSLEKVLICLSMFCQFYPILAIIFFREGDFNMLFLWDANGRDCLPYWGLQLL